LNFEEARQFTVQTIQDLINGMIQTREDAEYAEVPPWLIPSHEPTTSSTVTVYLNLINSIIPGRPVLYVQNDIPYYGRLKTVAADTWTIQGAPMILGTKFAQHGFFIGYANSILQIDFHLPGLYGAAATTTGLLSVAGRYYSWEGVRARLVAFAARHVTDDGASNPKINMLVNGNRVSTNNGGLGIQPIAASWVWNPDVAIHTTNYIVETGDPIEIEITAAGGAGNAANLTVSVFIAIEKRAMSDIFQLVNRHQRLE
jgi:hypothetical protein